MSDRIQVEFVTREDWDDRLSVSMMSHVPRKGDRVVLRAGDQEYDWSENRGWEGRDGCYTFEVFENPTFVIVEPTLVFVPVIPISPANFKE